MEPFCRCTMLGGALSTLAVRGGGKSANGGASGRGGAPALGGGGGRPGRTIYELVKTEDKQFTLSLNDS